MVMDLMLEQEDQKTSALKMDADHERMKPLGGFMDTIFW